MKTKINELRKDKKFTLGVFVGIFLILMLVGIKFVSAASSSTYIYASKSGYLTDPDGNYVYVYKKLGSTAAIANSPYPWTDSSGNIYYCVQPNTSINLPGYFSESSTTFSTLTDEKSGLAAVANDERIKLIMYYGYGYTGRTSDYWWRITQVMIWQTLYPDATIYFTTDTSLSSSVSKTTRYDDEMAAIEADIASHGKKPSFNLSNLGEIGVGESITVTDSNGVLSNFTVASCTNCTATISGNNLTVTATEVGNISISLTRSYNKANNKSLKIYENTSEGGQKVTAAADPTNTTASLSATGVYISSDVYAEKVDGDTGELVEGATICLYDSTMTELDCQTSSSTDAIYFGEYEKGTYYIQETVAPKGYAIDEKVYMATVDGYGTTVSITVTDYKWSTFTLYKYDGSTLEPLSSVKIALYDSDDVKLFEGWTDSEGKISTEKILTGTYYYVELETVDGYVLDTTKHYFDITSDGGCYVYEELENTPTSITITKTDISTGEPVSGATITIYQKQDDDTYTEYVSKVTDDDGKIVVEYLPYGDYYFVETEAPEGYILNDEKHYFTITATDGIIVDTLTNTKYSTATIRKYNLSETTVVPGATIELYHVTTEGDELLWTCTTDANGECYYDLLVIGNYYYIETEAPEGYVIDTAKHEFSITEAGQELQMSFNNEKKSTVTLTKVDASSGDLLQYATICIYTTDNELVGCVETDEDGVGIIQLPIGSYYYVETIAPPDFEEDGVTYRYVIDDEYYYFDVTIEGSSLAYTVENDWVIVSSPNTGLSSTEIYLSIIVVITGMTLLIVSTKVLKEQKEQVNNETTKITSNDDVQPIVEDNQTNEVKVEEISNNENSNEDPSQVE